MSGCQTHFDFTKLKNGLGHPALGIYGFGPGSAYSPTDLGCARPAQMGLWPENFGPNTSLMNEFGFGPTQGPTNLGWARKFWPKPIYHSCISKLNLTKCFFKVKWAPLPNYLTAYYIT